MGRGQVTKNLHDNEDGIYIAIHPYGEGMISVSDKLYASPKVASNNRPGAQIVKISKQLIMQLHNEQNGGVR
jgi:hypothetical protein